MSSQHELDEVTLGDERKSRNHRVLRLIHYRHPAAMLTEGKVTEFICVAHDFCQFFDATTAKYATRSVPNENHRAFCHLHIEGRLRPVQKRLFHLRAKSTPKSESPTPTDRCPRLRLVGVGDIDLEALSAVMLIHQAHTLFIHH